MHSFEQNNFPKELKFENFNGGFEFFHITSWKLF